ncbi:MAG: family 10 glycosylhydrolase [Prevotellaceae bacterium]|nr:family 10 glycosylhydrolase [Prevotellaceae bacterium]
MNYIYNVLILFALFLFLPPTLKGQSTNIYEETDADGYLSETEEFLPHLFPTHPLRETRAVWLTTIGGLDWPRIKATDTASRERQKAELVKILDNYKKANINTVIFQTRVRAAVVYPSKIEPWELCLTGVAGKDPGYDPLAFCIDECHKRGMELHAWVVCIPIGTTQRQSGYGSASLAKKHRELVKTAKGGEMFMIPGKPQTADYIANICKEIAENYDIDGISLDYIRYPEKSYNFSDDEFYPRSSGLSKTEWRRDNITRIVRAVHDAVKPMKPWVKLSSSPVGKYCDTHRYSAGGWNCYHAVYQDPRLWLRENYQDMLFPMMYFVGNNFYPFLFDWAENCYGHPIIPGLGIYFLDPREGRWQLNDVRAEMHTARHSGIGGIAFYRGEFLTNNVKGIYDAACDEFFSYPALTARMTWTADTVSPMPPAYIRYDKGKLFWASSATNTSKSKHPHDYILYNVYGSNIYPVDVTKSENLIATNIRDTEYELVGRALKVRHYAVTAIDRFGNESDATQEDKPVIEPPKYINVPRLINRDADNSKAYKTNKKTGKKTVKKR